MTGKTKLKCAKCGVKITLADSISCTCSCGKSLCSTHRYFNEHDCTFDYKERDKKIIERNNPKIVADKIIMI